MPRERDNIRSLSAYVPGEQPTAAQTAAGTVIKLNTNENAYPPSPAVMEAVRGVTAEALRLYPPADAAPFRAAAAALHGVDRAQIIATNGGDELLRLLVTVFCLPRDPDGERVDGRPLNPDMLPGGLGMTDPSYSLYGVLAGIHDTPGDRGAAGRFASDGGFPRPDDYATRLNAAGCRLAFLVNPHAPSGGLESVDALRALAADFDGLLVIDEAYADFAPEGDGGAGVRLVREGVDNVIVLRSLSKGYALAGLRFGYGLASAALIATLDKARDSYNLDALAQAAATAALNDQAYARGRWEQTRHERERVTAKLRERRVCDARQPHQLRAGPRARRRTCGRRRTTASLRPPASSSATSTPRGWPTGCGSPWARPSRTMRCLRRLPGLGGRGWFEDGGLGMAGGRKRICWPWS